MLSPRDYLAQRFTAGLSRRPRIGDYLLAVGLAVVAVMGRAALDLITPGAACFILLFPALVFAGAFFGTAPAAVAAAVGGSLTAALILGKPLLAWPPFSAVQLDALLFVPSCAAILWATASLRQTAISAAAAEARLQEVFRQIPGAAAILAAPEGRLLISSAQSEAILGHSPRQVITTYGGIHADHRPFAADDYPIVRALKYGAIIQGESMNYRRPDGRIVALDVHAGPVRGPDGSVVAAVGMAFDISERNAAERQLRQSEALHRTAAQSLQAAIDAASLGLWELDLDTSLLRLDATLAAMLGLPAEPVEMPRERLQDFVQLDDRMRAAAVLDGAIAEGSAYSDELRLRTLDGAERWLITRGAVLADMRKVVGVVSNITERRQREDALRDALHARDLLMHEADHRIKNSLQLVVSLLSLQINRIADADARQALNAAITRVQAIADAHRALESSPDLRSMDADRMLREICDRVGSLNPAITTRCEVTIDRSMDADQAIPLGLLATEVLTNALRHAYPPGAAGEITLTANVTAGILEMTITDGGIGLPAAPKRRGLGTTLINGLARQIGATVTTQSRPGAGTTVSLRLPLPAEDAPLAAVAQ